MSSSLDSDNGLPYDTAARDRVELVEAVVSVLQATTGVASNALLLSLAREGWLSEKHKKSEIDDMAERLIAQELMQRREG